MCDPSFERYVSLQSIGTAWLALDLTSLLDAVIGLREGESALFRVHHCGITADGLLNLTIEAAFRLQNGDILKRITRLSESWRIDEIGLKVDSFIKQLDSSSMLNRPENHQNLLANLVGCSNSIPVSSHHETASVALLLDRLARVYGVDSFFQSRFDLIYVDFDGRNGDFSVAANNSNGVHARNTNQVRRFRFTAAGTWGYSANGFCDYRGFDSSGNGTPAPTYSPGQNFMLPGANIGSLIAWGGTVPQMQTLEAKSMEVQLNPMGQVILFMNDNLDNHGFRDNVGQLNLHWEEIDPIFS